MQLAVLGQGQQIFKRDLSASSLKISVSPSMVRSPTLILEVAGTRDLSLCALGMMAVMVLNAGPP